LIAKWSYPTFTGCTLTGNRAEPYSGGAISCWHSGPLIEECSFLDNSTALDGGAIFAGGVSSPTLQNCLLLRNVASHRGGAIRCYYATRVDVISSTLVENSAPGGGIYTDLSGPITIEHSILAAGASGAAVVCGDASTVAVSCCDVFGNGGGDWTGCIADQAGQNGNFSLDPQFCDLPGDDLGLEPSSPCAPANSGSCGLIGAFPVGCSAVSASGPDLQAESWGGIKALYR
jgi:predicted outer membrane repeat protein